eukprot:CAMPEP_0172319462 /NCGR_PEP_ID=MMETSP1058-20130122/37713_1 /TAXON_ID=83371 /ORGANISM="Detonula confervacea, Strain CCMP 353" /LENGTH=96 /DNA_ID=CAMNT_0013034507 /DNA_START=76 /DNA_END=366 /DNA_ORIENTATION=+
MPARLLVCLSFLMAIPAMAGKGIPPFGQNTKVMYEKILDKTPWFVRSSAQAKLDKAIADLCEGIITENCMYKVVKQTTPSLFLQKSLDIIDEHKTS